MAGLHIALFCLLAILPKVVSIGFEQTLYTATEGEDPFVELCAVVIGNVQLEREAVVSFATRDSTATSIAPVDFVGVAEDFTFGPGVSRVCVEVTIEDDNIFEDEEEFFGTLTTTDPDVVVNPDEARVVITEDPMDKVTIGFEEVTFTVNEGETVRICAILSEGTLERDAIVTLSISDNTAMELMDDQPSVDLTFNEVYNRGCGLVTIIDDDKLEIDKTYTVTLTTTDGDITLNPDSGIIAAMEQDELVIGYEFPEYVVDETAGQVNVCVVVTSGTIGTPFRTTHMLEENTATEPEDFIRPVAPLCLEISIVNDNFVDREFMESFFIHLTGTIPASPRITLSPNLTTIIIVDNDDQLQIGFLETELHVQETVPMVNLPVGIIQGDPEPGLEITVELTVLDGSAIDGEDYQSIATVNLVFSSVNREIATGISILDDNLYELPENFFANLILVTTRPNIIVDPSMATVSILDEDATSIQFDSPDYTVIEDNGTVTVCLTTSRGIAAALMVDVVASIKPSSDNPASTADFVPATQTITFPISTTASRVCTSFQITDDTLALEGNEQFRVDFTAPEGIQTGAIDTACVTIIDDDELGSNFNSTNYLINEDGGFVTVCVEKIGQTDRDFTVTFTSFETSPPEAKADDDFTSGSVTLNFPANERIICTAIDIADDFVTFEGDERFMVEITVDDPDVVPGPSSTVTIIDNDVVIIEFHPVMYTINEADEAVKFEVVRRTSTSEAVAVLFSTHQLSVTNAATSGVDYTVVTNLRVEIPPSVAEESVPVLVDIKDNSIAEGVEEFGAVLSLPADSFGVMLGVNNATAVIIDNDYPGPVSDVIWNPQSDSKVKVSWSAPLRPNGIVLKYHLVLVNYIGGRLLDSRTVDNSTFMLEFNSEELEAGVPFSFTIFATNTAGDGEHTTITNFTRELIPPAPRGVTIDRSSGTQMTVSWIPLTLEEARSLVQFYRVFYSPESSNRKKQSITTCFQSPCNVPGSESSVLIVGLDPSSSYSVMVVAVNGRDQEGELSETIITQATSSSDNVLAITGGVVAVVAVLLIIIGVIVIVVLVLRYRNKRDVLSVGKHESIQLHEVATSEDPDIMIKDNMAYSTVPRFLPRGNLPNPPIAIHQHSEDHVYDVIPGEPQATVNQLHKAATCSREMADYEVVEPEGNS